MGQRIPWRKHDNVKRKGYPYQWVSKVDESSWGVFLIDNSQELTVNGVEKWRLERNCMSCNESEMQGKNAFVSVQLLSDNSYRNEQTDIDQ